MIRNYLLTAFRTLWKNKKLTSINIFGLSMGIACSLLIVLFVKDERAYDKHHKGADRIFRVVKDFINDDGSRIPDATTPGPLAIAMQKEIPEVETITRIHPDWGGTARFEYNGTKYTEAKVWRVDSSFFDVFTVHFQKGDPKTALADLNSIIVTKSTAKRYFGNEDPIGKILRLDDQQDITVTGVIDDVPAQSHMHYDFLQTYRRLPARQAQTSWDSYNYYTYVKVRPGTDQKAFIKKIQDVHDRNTTDRFAEFYTQPLLDIHLTSKLKWELEPNGDTLYVTIFTIIGIFILVIAGINYINLATAKSSLRAKEIGIRKVSGAQRYSLVFQLLMESLMICLVSALLAIALSYVLLPIINELTQKQLQLLNNPMVLMYLGGVTIVIGLIAGIFPALYLSSFKPVAVLKGLKLNESGALNLRKSLVVVQFTISVALIIGALIIVQQMRFVQSANLGFDKERVLVLNNAWRFSHSDRSSFLNSIKQLTGVENATTASTILGQGFSTTRISAQCSDKEQQINFTSSGYDYLDVVGIELKEGRGFSENFPADSMNNGILGGPLNQRLGGIIINEQAVKDFGLESPAVGKQLVWSTDADTTYYMEVVGVTKDFHFTSLRNEIKPYAFILRPRRQGNFTIRLSGGEIPATLQQLETMWKKTFPEVPFEYSFLDQTFDKMYAAEARFQKVFISLVVLGIIIACLGLFALAAFSAEQRIKEIGIRKVLGASVTQVVALLSKDFLKLVLLSILVAIPIAYYTMQTWLAGFAYRIDLQWWIFAVAAVIALVIAFLTISSQAIKAAVTDPAKSLRAE